MWDESESQLWHADARLKETLANALVTAKKCRDWELVEFVMSTLESDAKSDERHAKLMDTIRGIEGEAS